MTAPSTPEDPADLPRFDHRGLAQLPEYTTASTALDALAHAIDQAGDPLASRRWLAIVADMAAALPYADACADCIGSVPTPAPVAADTNADGHLHVHYRCPDCGSTWTRQPPSPGIT